MKNNKKIDVIVKYFYPVAAGIETNVLETYSVLVKKGWDVTIHTSNLDYTTGEILKEKEEIKRLKVIRYPLTKFSYFPKVNYEKTSLVCLHNFDIFPHMWIMMSVLVKKILGKKDFSVVLTPHGGFNPEWRVFSKLQALIKATYHFTLGALLINLSVDALRAVSYWEKDWMIKRGIKESKIEVIVNGLEDEAFMDLKKKASKKIKDIVKDLGDYIIQIGRIYPIKNYETVIKALPKVNKNIKFVIVGPTADKQYKNELVTLSEKLGVSDRVIFLGVVRGVDKYYLIKNAKTMVHMAIWESFCNVIHEALSQGLIPIAANNTALPYIIKDGDNGLLVETRDHKSLSKSINYLLKNLSSKKYRDMSKRNKIKSKEESWANVAAKMDRLYKKLV